MDGKAVQLVQGREKALEEESPLAVLDRFAGFPEIQVIDLDAAMGRGNNDHLVGLLASRAVTRVGGGVRTVERAQTLIAQGAHRVIVGTSAFHAQGIHHEFLESLAAAIGPQRLMLALDSKDGRIVVRGWRESTALTAEQVIRPLEPYCSAFLCTYVDKEGMMLGTNLEWFRALRAVTSHAITAAGGVTTLDDIRALAKMGIDAAIGMAIYTGRLNLDELRAMIA
jgi:phosphoribosylformimino-5-aminoimidazole carboxamide ribonucleotide (ProFAR) isomerase